MDIRDIKEEPRVIEDSRYLEEIYSLQKELLKNYQKIERLPPYPIDVNTKESQVILKDLTGRVIEELAEGYESHILIKGMVEKVGLNLDLMDEDIYNNMISHLQNLNEELADALHFMVELLIYANIEPEDINSWIDKKYLEIDGSLPERFKKNPDILNKAGLLYYSTWQSKVRVINSIPLLDVSVSDEQVKYLPGAKFYSDVLVEEDSCKCLWDITYSLNISRNCLKNKPWKQTGVMTNEVLYQSKLVESFVSLIGYFSLLSITPEELYYIYFKKNKVNQFRIESKY